MDLSERIIPPLRADVELVEGKPGDRLPFAAVDRTLGQRIKLDQTGAMLASALDRPWLPPELLMALGQHGLKLSPALLVRFVRFLDGHYLLSGDRADAHIEAVRAADNAPAADALPLVFQPGTQHDCVACGASCGGHDVGPVAPERVAAIRALLPDARFVHRETSDADTRGDYCAMSGDECSFLQDDRLCSIHAKAGLDPKPTDCRIFPLAFVRTPQGVRTGVRLECRSYLESKRNGGALSERTPELRLLAGRLPSMNEVPTLVRLDPAMTLPYGRWIPLRDELIATAAEHPQPLWAGLAALNAQAKVLVDRARAEDRLAWVFPPDEPEPSGATADEVIGALIEGVQQATEMNAAAGNIHRAERFARVAAAAKALLAGRDAGAALTPPAGDDPSEIVRDHLVQSLYLEDPLMGPNVRFGLGLLNLSVLLAVAGHEQADSFNGALADTLKCLRTGPVLGRLHKKDDAVAEWFHARLENWVSS